MIPTSGDQAPSPYFSEAPHTTIILMMIVRAGIGRWHIVASFRMRFSDICPPKSDS
jgi:hypothetical protein